MRSGERPRTFRSSSLSTFVDSINVFDCHLSGVIVPIVCLVYGFMSQSTAMVMSRLSQLTSNHTFSCASLTKRFTCTDTNPSQISERMRMTRKYFMINLHESSGDLRTPGSAIRLATNCAMGHSILPIVQHKSHLTLSLVLRLQLLLSSQIRTDLDQNHLTL